MSTNLKDDVLNAANKNLQNAYWMNTDMMTMYFEDIFKCSNCQNESKRRSRYCPDCGARMQGVS